MDVTVMYLFFFFPSQDQSSPSLNFEDNSGFLQLMLNKVLMLGSKDQTIIGRPVLPKAAVFAVVEEHVRKRLSFLLFWNLECMYQRTAVLCSGFDYMDEMFVRSGTYTWS
jgi:hypothetical protein